MFRTAWHAGISIALCTLIRRMVHTPLRVHVRHTSPLSSRSHLYYAYMHKHTRTRSHMLSDPYAALQPECACPCIFGGCSWAQSPAPAPVPECTPQLPNRQYSSSLSKAGDAPEEALIWRRKSPRFSACALCPHPDLLQREKDGMGSPAQAGVSFLK